MKNPRLTCNSNMDLLKRKESGISEPDLCQELAISSETAYEWRVIFGSMDTSMMSVMKELEGKSQGTQRIYVEDKLEAELLAASSQKR